MVEITDVKATAEAVHQSLKIGGKAALQTLQTLNTFTTARNQKIAELYKELATIPTEDLFSTLEYSEEFQWDIAKESCKVLEAVVNYIDADLLLGQYRSFLTTGSQHELAEVRNLVLSIAIKMAQSEQDFDKAEKAGFLSECLCLTIDSAPEVHKKACQDFVQSLIAREWGRDYLFRNDIQDELLEILQDDSSARLRIYVTLTNIIAQDGGMGVGDMISSSRYISQALLGDLRSDDVLLKTALIEELSTMGSTTAGYQWLKTSGILEIVYNTFGDDVDPLNQMLMVPVAWSFLSSLAYAGFQEALQDMVSHNVGQRLGHSLQDSNQSTAGRALTFGCLVMGQQGYFEAIVKTTPGLDRVLVERMRTLLFGPDPEIRADGMKTFALTFENTEPITGPTPIDVRVQFLQAVFQGKGDAMTWMTKQLSHPIDNLRDATLRFMLAFAQYKQGRTAIGGTAGFVELITSRTGNFSKLQKERKHTLVGLLLRAGDAEELFGKAARDQMSVFYDEGPYKGPDHSLHVGVMGAT
eukprot:Clim_evm30s152 gene=Clim_evmTU30s152